MQSKLLEEYDNSINSSKEIVNRLTDGKKTQFRQKRPSENGLGNKLVPLRMNAFSYSSSQGQALLTCAATDDTWFTMKNYMKARKELVDAFYQGNTSLGQLVSYVKISRWGLCALVLFAAIVPLIYLALSEQEQYEALLHDKVIDEYHCVDSTHNYIVDHCYPNSSYSQNGGGGDGRRLMWQQFGVNNHTNKECADLAKEVCDLYTYEWGVIIGAALFAMAGLVGVGCVIYQCFKSTPPAIGYDQEYSCLGSSCNHFRPPLITQNVLNRYEIDFRHADFQQIQTLLNYGLLMKICPEIKLSHDISQLIFNYVDKKSLEEVLSPNEQQVVLNM